MRDYSEMKIISKIILRKRNRESRLYSECCGAFVEGKMYYLKDVLHYSKTKERKYSKKSSETTRSLLFIYAEENSCFS